MSLLYFFDIGNTRGKFWKCRDGLLETTAYIRHERNMKGFISKLPVEFDESPDSICGLSVVSERLSDEFKRLCQEKWCRVPLFASSGRGFDGVTNGYEMPGTLGVDRWLGLIAAYKKGINVCVVGCGTAVTLDVLENGAHAGGYILPGLALIVESLEVQTARVRFVEQIDDGVTLGRSTAEAVVHGALLSTVAMIEKVVGDRHISNITLTGGDAERISKFLRLPHVVEPNLLLRGLQKYFAD